MLKKVGIIAVIILITLLSTCSYAVTADGNAVLNSDETTELIQIKESTKATVSEYIDKYGSTPYGVAAYILATVRIYSIPFCFIGIAIGSVYQYVIGIRKLDVRDKGFAMIIMFVTILLICQILPLIFAIVVNGWRG
jgi:hypothetical protein